MTDAKKLKKAREAIRLLWEAFDNAFTAIEHFHPKDKYYDDALSMYRIMQYEKDKAIALLTTPSDPLPSDRDVAQELEENCMTSEEYDGDRTQRCWYLDQNKAANLIAQHRKSAATAYRNALIAILPYAEGYARLIKMGEEKIDTARKLVEE